LLAQGLSVNKPKKSQSAIDAVLAGARELRLPVLEIEPRFNDSTRMLDPEHVISLAESISALGLIEPLAVDQKLRLVAGGHRWVALRLLAEEPSRRAALGKKILTSDESSASLFDRLNVLPVLTDQVPVHILDFDSKTSSAEALAIEIAENEKRRNYTPVEVRRLAETMRSAGFRDTHGRPKAGEKALAPALAVVLGKSERTVRRLLADANEMRTNVLISGTDLAQSEDRRLVVALTRWKERRGLYGQGVSCRKAYNAALELQTLMESLLDETKEQ
jgi:ParB family chromosome partitioning protein